MKPFDKMIVDGVELYVSYVWYHDGYVIVDFETEETIYNPFYTKVVLTKRFDN